MRMKRARRRLIITYVINKKGEIVMPCYICGKKTNMHKPLCTKCRKDKYKKVSDYNSLPTRADATRATKALKERGVYGEW